ncbi:MAG: hypothetical protein IKE28_10860 [Solobacterium sp.]|nr:hypothetical protein [Solobacterium sp.]
MKLIVLSGFLGVFLLSAMGIHLFRILNAEPRGFSLPAGLAFFFALLQIGYYPVQIFHGPFKLILFITAAVLLYALYCLIREWKAVIKELFQWKTLWILAGTAAFLAVFYLCYIDLEYSDSPMYLNYIAQNIGIDRLNLFNLYTGVKGQEWDGLYLYQGYYHFVSAYITILNLPARLGIGSGVETLKGTVWGMGLLYSLVSGALIINILNILPVKSKWMKGVFAVFALFYLNLYYWRVVFAFYGNTYRSLLITFLMFAIYEREAGAVSRKASTVLLMLISFAGIACSSSYLFVSFAVLSIYAAYRFLSKEEGSLYDMSLIVLPLAVYASVAIRRSSKAGYAIGLFFLLYYAFCRTKPVQKLLSVIEQFLIRYAKIIFIGIIPGLCMAFALYLHITKPDYLYGYSYYFNNHQNYDMVKDYFFVYSTWYDNIINVLRWLGLILFCKQAVRREDKYLRTASLLGLLVFMNPLCTPTIAWFIASNVFYRTWEILFNPLSELLFFSAIVLELREQKWAETALSVCLILVVLVSNTLALRGEKDAAYGFYIAGADENYRKVEKMDRYGLETVLELQKALEEEPIEDRQPIVISQAEGTRVYLPNVVQLVTARDEYYSDTRVNEELYQIAKRHHPWDTEDHPEYEKTCSLLKQYDVDYIIVRYWENPDFDEAANACAFDIYQNSYFRLKKVEH